jgi:hypothetical protein
MVSADAMVRAGAYLDYAAGMLDRVTAGLAIGEAEVDASAIARHLLATHAPQLNERELYRMAGFAWAREDKRRAAALRVLENMGWIRRQIAVGKGRPKSNWEVSPRLRETCR